MMSATSEDTPKRMGKTKKGDRLDASHFQSPGINYKGKLIGVEDVPGPRGDKMCQVAMAKVKAAVKTIGEHKLKIIVNISLEGVRIVEEKSESVLYYHPVQRISFISRDPGDSRAFGYIYGREDGTHQFYGIKTEKVAENIVLNLRDLFQIVYEMKKQEKEDSQDSVVHESQPVAVRKGQSTKNVSSFSGLDQLNVYSSSIAMLSSSQKVSSKIDSSGNQNFSGSSQSPVSQETGFRRGFLQHHASEIKHSSLMSRHSQFVAKQYSSLTSSERHQLHPPFFSSSVTSQPQSPSDAAVARTSPSAKLRPQYSSGSGWFPVTIPPPDVSSSLGRRTAMNPVNGLGASVADSSAESWAVFETNEQSDPAVAFTGWEKSGGVTVETILENVEDARMQTSELIFKGQTSDEACVVIDSEPEKCLGGGGEPYTVEVKKVLLPKTANEANSESPVDVISCTFYSHVERGDVSPKSPSGVPKLASPESLSDDDEEEAEDEGEENFIDTTGFPSPDAPPPPLPLDSVVDYTLQPPVLPPRPAVFEFTVSRFNAEPAESPIYGNLPVTESTAKNSFTLPRPRPAQSNGGDARTKVRPIQAGYDLTMPRPRPVPNLNNLRPHDDLDLSAGHGNHSRPRFLRGTTVSVCQNEDSNEIIFKNLGSVTSQRSNTAESTFSRSSNDTNFSNDPFAICLLSKSVKPQTIVSLSSAANDGLIHTSVSPIPRPRPRQRSVPSASRDSAASVASTTESPMKNVVNTSSPLPGSVDGNQLDLKHLNRCRSESNRSEHSPNSLSLSRRKAESLSDKFTRIPGRVHKESTGSNRSDNAPDPFIQVDPFATESFSDDPFSSQPDPLSFESPSDPFSKEFPKKASLFFTRAVTVEMGDVFDDVSSTPYEPDKKTAAEISAVVRNVHASASESAMERKSAILLEKATGDSAAITIQRPNLCSLDDQNSHTRTTETFPKEDSTIYEGNGRVFCRGDPNKDSLRQISVRERQAGQVIKEEPEINPDKYEHKAKKYPHAIKSDVGEFKPKICNSAPPVDVAEGFSDSFDPVLLCLDSHLDKTYASRSQT